MTLLLWLCKIVHAARHAIRKWFYRRLGTAIGQNVRLYGGLDGVNPDKITIGNNTVIAKAAQIIAHCPVRGNAPVRIGANCYIGYGAIILPGVTVGDNCIIGAGSVVTRDIPPNSIAYGNPARLRRHRNAAELARTVQQVETGQTVMGLIRGREYSIGFDPAIKLCNYFVFNEKAVAKDVCMKDPVNHPGMYCVALQGQPCEWFDKTIKPLAPYGYVERKETP